MPVILGKSFWQPLEVPGCDDLCEVRLARPTARMLLKYRKDETLIIKRKIIPNRSQANLDYVPKLIKEFRKGHWIFEDPDGKQTDLADMPLKDAVTVFCHEMSPAVDTIGDILFHASESSEEADPHSNADDDDDDTDGGISLPNSEARSDG